MPFVTFGSSHFSEDSNHVICAFIHVFPLPEMCLHSIMCLSRPYLSFKIPPLGPCLVVPKSPLIQQNQPSSLFWTILLFWSFLCPQFNFFVYVAQHTVHTDYDLYETGDTGYLFLYPQPSTEPMPFSPLNAVNPVSLLSDFQFCNCFGKNAN